MANISGYLSAADTVATADALAGIFRQGAYYLPQINAVVKAIPALIQGDGVATYGISNADLKAQMNKAGLPTVGYGFDYTRMWASYATLLSTINNQIRTSLPSGWNYVSAGTSMLDAHLTRVNGAAGSPVQGVPTAGTLTATSVAGGAIANCSAGNAPRVTHALVGTYDINESLPSGEATQVALTGTNNSYTYQIAGTVPPGVTKVRLRRGVVGGATGNYGWSKDIPVTAGALYPAITISEADATLRLDVIPASWMCAPMTAEFAALWALANSGQTGASGLFASANQLLTPVQMNAYGMLSPTNVAMNPSNGFMGIGNPTPSNGFVGANPTTAGMFGEVTITGASAFTYSAGSYPTANVPASNVQGFAGATLLQSRVLTALGAGSTFSLTYTYYQASTGWGSLQTSGTVNITHVTGAVGETISIPITAGQVVQSVTITGKGGAATTGTTAIEAAYPRTIQGQTGTPSGWTSGIWGS